MAIANFLMANWQSLVSIAAMILAVGVAISHLAHKDAIAAQLQKIEDLFNSVPKGPVA